MEVRTIKNPHGKIAADKTVLRECMIYDRKNRTYLKAKYNDITTISKIIEIIWSDTGANTGVVPDIDKIIDCGYARSIIIQAESVHGSNTSTDFDVNVMGYVEEYSEFMDSVPYRECNIGDAERQSFLVTPGLRSFRLRGDNNAAGTTGYIKVRVLLIE